MNRFLLILIMILTAFLLINLTHCSSGGNVKAQNYGPKPTSKGSLLFTSYNRLPDNYQFTDKNELKIDKPQWVQLDFNSPEGFNVELRNDVTGNVYVTKNTKGKEFSALKWIYIEAGSYQVLVFSAGKSGNYVLKVYSAGGNEK